MSVSLQIPVCDVLCLVGSLSSEHLAWLEENEGRYIIALSDVEKRVHERLLTCAMNDESRMQAICWELVFLRFYFGDSSDPALAKLAHIQQEIHLIASDFQERGIDRLKNFMGLEKVVEKALPAKGLFGAFKGLPAIVCGGGVSLDGRLEEVRAHRSHALIFSGGSALAHLLKEGVVPHFGGMIDPHTPSERYRLNGQWDLPLFFQRRVHPEYLAPYRGPHLLAPGGRNDLFEEEVFEGGWNVATFLVAIAHALGCSPIILVGVDLAQRGEASYAGGQARSEGGERIAIGEGLFSRADWLKAGEWLGQFATFHPETEWINLSEGVAIKGFKTDGWSSLSKAHSIDDRVDGELAKLSEIGKRGKEQQVRKSLAVLSNLCDRAFSLLESLFPKPPEKNGEYALLLIEREKEIAYTECVVPAWEVWKHVFSREVPKGLPPSYGLGLNEWLFIKGICDASRDL